VACGERNASDAPNRTDVNVFPLVTNRSSQRRDVQARIARRCCEADDGRRAVSVGGSDERGSAFALEGRGAERAEKTLSAVRTQHLISGHGGGGRELHSSTSFPSTWRETRRRGSWVVMPCMESPVLGRLTRGTHAPSARCALTSHVADAASEKRTRAVARRDQTQLAPLDLVVRAKARVPVLAYGLCAVRHDNIWAARTPPSATRERTRVASSARRAVLTVAVCNPGPGGRARRRGGLARVRSSSPSPLDPPVLLRVPSLVRRQPPPIIHDHTPLTSRLPITCARAPTYTLRSADPPAVHRRCLPTRPSTV
jgi:hypothetical protein